MLQKLDEYKRRTKGNNFFKHKKLNKFIMATIVHFNENQIFTSRQTQFKIWKTVQPERKEHHPKCMTYVIFSKTDRIFENVSTFF